MDFINSLKSLLVSFSVKRSTIGAEIADLSQGCADDQHYGVKTAGCLNLAIY